MFLNRACAGMIALLGGMTLSVPAMAAGDWIEFEELKGGFVESGGSAFTVACVDGNLTIRITLPLSEMHADIAGLDEIDITLAADVRGASRNTSSISDLPFGRHDANGEAFSQFSGPAAEDWARYAMHANRDFEIAWTPHYDRAGYKSYNSTTFSAAGSSATIKPALADCGL